MTDHERNQTVAELLSQSRYSFKDLVHIMEILRMPGGCMWDAEQTHKSIRDDMIEETYEVIEAIDNDDPVLLREELGDALLQVVFHARIEEEEGRFNIDDVISDISAKLIHRHPHVFGTVTVNSTEHVLQNWEKIKIDEKKRETLVSRLEAVPPQLPALMRAAKIAKKTAFFDDELSLSDASKRVRKALETFEASEEGEREILAGELLYTVTDLCRRMSVSAEAALAKKTIRRIDEIRSAEAFTNGAALDTLTKEERDALRKRLDALDAEEAPQ